METTEDILETVDFESRCIYGEVKDAEPVGNAAAMRKAIDGIKNTANSALTALSIGNDTSSFLWAIIRKCESALAEPPRNCDVGTAKEQDKRFDAFCYAHRSNEKGCENCPLLNGVPCCELAWAQMPYKEVK